APSPRRIHNNAIVTDLFQDDFVASRKWFRRLFIWVPLPHNAHTAHKLFIPSPSPFGDANPIKSADVSGETAWTDVSHFIAARDPTVEYEHGRRHQVCIESRTRTDALEQDRPREERQHSAAGGHR